MKEDDEGEAEETGKRGRKGASEKKLPQSSDLLPEYRGASHEPSQHLRWTQMSQNQNPAVEGGD